MGFLEAMRVQHSRMEWDVLEDLNRAGLFPLMDKSFPVLSTTPDFFFPDKNLAVYLDGEKVHAKRQEKDQELRRLLAKRHGVTVLTFPYKRRTKKARQKIVEQIIEWTK